MKGTQNLFLACYELGHQPLSVAWPLAQIREAGHHADGIDLSRTPFPETIVSEAKFIGISVPMHTAMRLGMEAARRVREINQEAHICFYGLYAWLNAEFLLTDQPGDGFALADSIVAGELEATLAKLVAAVSGGMEIDAIAGVMTASSPADPILSRQSLPEPDRSTLPDLDHYAYFSHNGRRVLAGYTETTRGCLHHCTHCPVVPVYRGRLFVVPADVVLADIRKQVAMGARHITFGDPDFLNGPGHVLRIARVVHQEFPRLTFNFTTKVEHILDQPEVIGELRQLGASFMVSAFESTSNEVLARLKKGHTVADLDRALDIAAAADLPIQPTWVPFTPWNTLEDYLELLEWIESRSLVQSTPAVQLSIRLLIPPKSRLLEQQGIELWLGELDHDRLSYQWRHNDPRMDELQLLVARKAAEIGNSNSTAFLAIKRMAYKLADREVPQDDWQPWTEPANPRLTEDWFC